MTSDFGIMSKKGRDTRQRCTKDRYNKGRMNESEVCSASDEIHVWNQATEIHPDVG